MARKWSDWIEWNGGECPVPPETVVDVVLRHRRDAGESWPPGGSKKRPQYVAAAKMWRWGESGNGQIVAYAIATDEADA